LTEFLIQAFATLVGAAAAFGLEALRRHHERQQTQIEQFKAALFVLILHRTFLRTLHAQQLMPQRENPIRSYSLYPILVAPPHGRVDLLALSFLLSSKEAELLNKLGVAEEQYRSVVALVEQRNQLHLAFQVRLQAASDATGISEVTPDDIRAIAGKMLARQLEDLTDELYRTTEHAIGFNRDVYETAVSSFKLLFPKSPMFGVEDLPLSKSDAA
jgi:mRNA-degrading endonuclease toxin of MazEF toxin-antitoxin module